jgi:hypothetical protein
MTFEDAIIEIYESSDEQSDLSPYTGSLVDLASEGAKRIRRAIVRAQDAIATWKLPNGHRVRFRELEDSALVSIPVVGGDAQDLDDVNRVGIVPALRGDVTPYAGRVLRFTDDGSTYFIVASTLAALTVAPALPANAGGRAFTIHTRSWIFNGLRANCALPWRLIETIDLTDTQTQRVLGLSTVPTRFSETMRSVDVPTTFVKSGNGIILDSAPIDARVYVLRAMRYPNEPAELADELELPRAFHDAIVIHATHWALGRIGEGSRQIAVWNKLDRLMMTLRTQTDLETDYESGKMYPAG